MTSGDRSGAGMQAAAGSGGSDRPDDSPGRAQADGLIEMLDDLRPAEAEAGGHTTLGDLVERLGRRGHAAAIFAPALLALSPVGAIPGMSIATGAIILGMAGQLALGRDGLWMPRRAARVEVPADRLNDAIDWLEPKLVWLDRLFRRRLPQLGRGPAERLLALPMILLALLMFPLAVVPFGVAMPSAALCLLSLGLAVGDGLVVAFGLAASAAATAGSVWAIGSVL
ncbi:exopolysaccharide biosynthesis protein [Marinibaculum pumilum]|uniref:Exopolysaccharide biosynthesis protein n=1 Tax=Marinibaculum pumilum TaxID=1766165 RepID=A0ABV7L3Z8_9PROT